MREAGDGFDGSWVAHPDLVPVCTEVFDGVLGDKPNQLDVRARREHLGRRAHGHRADPRQPTEEGLADDIRVGLHYIAAWLGGRGAVAISNLMEDAATAEIARSQVWQWVHAGVFTKARVLELIEQQTGAGRGRRPAEAAQARRLFTEVALGDRWPTSSRCPVTSCSTDDAPLLAATVTGF